MKHKSHYPKSKSNCPAIVHQEENNKLGHIRIYGVKLTSSLVVGFFWIIDVHFSLFSIAIHNI